MAGNPMAGWLRVTVATCLPTMIWASLLPSVLDAQSPEYRKQLARFQAGMKAKIGGERIAAAEVFAKCGVPDALGPLLAHQLRVQRGMKKLRRRFDARARLVARAARAGDVTKADRQKLRESHGRIVAAESLDAALIGAAGSLLNALDTKGLEAGLKYVARELEKRRVLAERLPVIALLGECSDARAGVLVSTTAWKSDLPTERLAALRALEKQDSEAAVATISEAVSDEAWQVRSRALRVVNHVRKKAFVPVLIAALPRESGRLLAEVATTLRSLTGMDFHTNAPLWRNWWTQHGGSFEVPARAPPEDEEEDDADTTPGAPRRTGFFGITTDSDRILYVLDVSGSMNRALSWKPGDTGGLPLGGATNPFGWAPRGKRKVDAAIRELERSIASIPETGALNIVCYSDGPKVWKKTMQPATARNKAGLKKWMRKVAVAGETNTHGALKRAFAMAGDDVSRRDFNPAMDTIFFLADGHANCGGITNPRILLREVKRLNESRMIEIHCVALGAFANQQFLRSLAEENDGRFVFKEQP